LSWQINGKYNNTWQHYLNPEYLGSTGSEDYRYGQQEGYLSAVLMHPVAGAFTASASTDAAIATMSSNLHSFTVPTRYTLLENLALKYSVQRLTAVAGVLGTCLRETTSEGSSGADILRLSPSVSLSFQPVEHWHSLRLRAFWKSSFRAPSFNDLYYSAIGNTQLKPENSHQLNLGLTMGDNAFWPGFKAGGSVDVYHNEVTNKIQAIPTRNIFIWSMTNLGTVDIQGLDLNVHASKSVGQIQLSAEWNHTYQKALDKTDPTSKTYDQQIAYAPRIYGSARFALDWKKATLGYNVLYSGHRYVTGQNLAENDLAGYQDHTLSLSYRLNFRKTDWTVKLDVQNLWDASYDIVRNFPMPGRSFRCSAQMNF
jgi:vitamin B12 transporter